MRYVRIVLLAAAVSVLSGCGGDAKVSSRPTALSTVTVANEPLGVSGVAVQLGGDPCALLTIPEMEAVLGSGVEQGGFGVDLPGRCTYSRFGDVGSGVVQITQQDPPTCNVVMTALASDSLDASATRIDVGDGGLFIQDAAAVFVIHGGCVAIAGSKHGTNLGQDALVSLATIAVSRVA